MELKEELANLECMEEDDELPPELYKSKSDILMLPY
jgi:hypothetical protein